DAPRRERDGERPRAPAERRRRREHRAGRGHRLRSLTATTLRADRGWSVRLFVSYARRDRAAVDELVGDLLLLGNDVWVDVDRLRGGRWGWPPILDAVAKAAASLFALSDAAVRSEACTAELAWAEALGKPVLPVRLDAVREVVMPQTLAVRQY